MATKKGFFFLVLLALLNTACENFRGNQQEPVGIETTTQVEELAELTLAEDISKMFSSSQDSATINNLKLKDFQEISEFYSAREFAPVWTSRDLREDLHRSISTVPEEGLNMNDYHGHYIKQSLSSLSDLNKEELTTLEIILTDAFFRLADHLNSGKINPKDLYTIWDIETNEIDIPRLLVEATTKNEVKARLDSLKPEHLVYQGLKKSLKEYEEMKNSEEEFTKIEYGESIEPGEEDPRIPSVVKRLEELGFTEISTDSISNLYDENLEEAVKQYQEEYGIEVDGILGRGTITSLNKSYNDRYNQILANLERWRWYPRDLWDHYILINIANYRLNVVKDGDTVASHLTMVGTEARKTPVFSDKIEHVVYNPTWTIPPTIKKDDVIPAASKNSSYLTNRNISVFDRTGQRLNPSEIDWSSDEVTSYTYRQRAGSSNPLGKVKIIYPNPYLIYLHDTPSQALFKKNTRAQSSGCVRVQDAVKLANYLLSDQEKYDEETLQKIIASGKTTTIKVTQDVKVHHLYWTAWREKGSTRFSADVYNLDRKIYELLNPSTE